MFFSFNYFYLNIAEFFINLSLIYRSVDLVVPLIFSIYLLGEFFSASVAYIYRLRVSIDI